MTRSLEEVAADTVRMLEGLRLPRQLEENREELRAAVAAHNERVEDLRRFVDSDRVATAPDPPTPEPPQPPQEAAELELSFEAYERACLARALQENGGSVLQAARALGVGKSTLYRKARTLGLR